MADDQAKTNVRQLTPRIDPLPRIIPYGSICLLIGAPNVGKTALLAGIARSFRDLTPIFGHQPNALPAIGLISADRGWYNGTGVWFERAGYADIKHYSMADDPFFDPRCLRRKFERTARLGEFIDRLQLPAGSLIKVDPIGLFLGGNLNDYDSCAVACHEIRTLLRARHLTLFGTAHTAKLKADRMDRYLRLEDQILGSTALSGFTDTVMYLASPEETGRGRYTFLLHPHATAQEVFDLERDEQGLFQLFTGEESGGRSNCNRVLLAMPDDGTPISVDELKTRVEPIADRTLERVLRTLRQEGRIERAGKGLYRRILPS